MSAAVDAEAVDLGERGAPDGVLCIHGLTGTPYEVRPLAEALAARGFRARSVWLPGHRDAAELARVPWTAWLDTVRGALDELAAEHERVFAAGLSLGGLLTLALASEGRVAGAAVVGTPLWLRAPIPQLVPVVKHLYPRVAKRAGSDIRDPEARARHPGLRVMPLASVHELVRLTRWLRPRLALVDAPLFVAHGRLDRTAPPACARAIHDAVSSRERVLALYERSGHVLTVDYEGPELSAAVGDFLSRV